MIREKCITVLDKALEYSFYGLAFFIPVSIAFTEIFTTLAITAFVLKSLLCLKHQRKAASPASSFFALPNIFILLFFCFCALSLVHCASVLPKSLNALFGKWGKFIMLYWVASASFAEEGRFRKMGLVFLASAALAVVDAFSQRFFSLEFLLHRPLVDVNFAGHTEWAVTGAFKHSNDFATYLICSIPLLAGIAVTHPQSVGIQESRRSGISSVSFLSVVLLLTFCLILTFSRGGWLGFIVACGMMCFLLPKKKFFFFLGLIFFALLFSSPEILKRAATVFGAGGDSGRYQLWDGAWAMIAQHPWIGNGVGTFMAFFQDYVQGRGAMYAHNCYLQMWAEVGVFGLLCFLLFLGTVFRSGFLALRRCAGLEMAPILAGLLCGALAFLVQSALDTNLYALQPSALFWLFLGMIRAMSGDESKERSFAKDRLRMTQKNSSF